MSTDSPVTTTEPEQGLVIDPFAFAPHQASRIRGLGGPEAANDPNYAFHTPYLFCALGDATFTLRFVGLHATSGNLTVRIHAMSTAPGATVRSIKMVAKPLAEVANGGGVMSVTIPAKPQTLYAVFGLVFGATDAVAADMSILLDRPDDGSALAEQLEEAQTTVFGQTSADSAPRLISTERASLARPVSQMCTSRQFDEPVYDQWVAAMGAEKHRHRKQWEFVYILQALSVYGMIEPDSRGLGFGVGGEPLPAVLAARGCEIVATDLPAGDERSVAWTNSGQHSQNLEPMRRPAICPDARFDEAVRFREVDMNAIPADLRDFDFCWSACALEHLGSIRAGLDFIVNSVRCLKIGGIAIHTTELNLLSNDATIDNEGTVLFRRKDFERMAMELVSLGHSVAQFKYDQGTAPIDRHIDMPPYASNDHLKVALGGYVTTSFGVIVQRGAPI